MIVREREREMEEERERGNEEVEAGSSYQNQNPNPYSYSSAEKEEKLGEKLRRGFLVGKRCGPTTPVVSSRSLFSLSNSNSSSYFHINNNNNNNKNNINSSAFITYNNNKTVFVSVRKLGAALWDLLNYLPLAKMHRGAQANGSGGGGGAGVGANGAPPPSRLRHVSNHNHHHRGAHHRKDKGVVVELPYFLADNNSLTSDPDQPASASSLRRHLVASLMQHHRTNTDRNSHALQPVSPASYGSSMEVAPYNPAGTPPSSMDFRGRVSESHYNLKTSTELIKVLNRIWSLEEQHASNMSLIKALKTELDHSRANVKELLRERQSDRHEIDDLVKQIAEGNISRKSKEQDRIQKELEDERKLRKRSETLHMKLGRELSKAKSALSGTLKELERERKSRKLLEDLCDEFANGIRDYEREVHFLKPKGDRDWMGRNDNRLILHVSESWLDERMQMKIEEARHGGVSEKDSVVNKLRVEIETFLQAKTQKASVTRERRHSVESVHLNEALSAPQNVDGDDNDDDADDDDDSLGSGSHCFELQKPNNEAEDEALKSSKVGERVKGHAPGNLQVKFEEKMARPVSSEGNDREGKPSETAYENRGELITNQGTGLAATVVDHSLRGESNDAAGQPLCSNFRWRNQVSPVRQWMAKLNSPDLDLPESSKTKMGLGSKDNTLKAKLLEARSKKGRKSRPKISC